MWFLCVNFRNKCTAYEVTSMWFLYADWQVATGEPDGFKSVTAFFPEGASNSNGTIYTHMQSDFVAPIISWLILNFFL